MQRIKNLFTSGPAIPGQHNACNFQDVQHAVAPMACSFDAPAYPPRPNTTSRNVLQGFEAAWPTAVSSDSNSEVPSLNETLRRWQQAAPPGEEAARKTATEKIREVYEDGLDSLNLNDAGLTSLPDCLCECTSLEKILVSKNQLTVLPDLPPGLEELEINYNRLTNLPDLPDSLTTLKAQFNELTGLPRLPNGLDEIWVGTNKLTSLPQLPKKLRLLHAWKNQLPRLPDLPSGLKVLNVHYNKIEALPALPEGLTMLFVANNELTLLYKLPTSLTGFNASYNPIPDTSIPSEILHIQELANEENYYALSKIGAEKLHKWQNTHPELVEIHPETLSTQLTVPIPVQASPVDAQPAHLNGPPTPPGNADMSSTLPGRAAVSATRIAKPRPPWKNGGYTRGFQAEKAISRKS